MLSVFFDISMVKNHIRYFCFNILCLFTKSIHFGLVSNQVTRSWNGVSLLWVICITCKHKLFGMKQSQLTSIKMKLGQIWSSSGDRWQRGSNSEYIFVKMASIYVGSIITVHVWIYPFLYKLLYQYSHICIDSNTSQRNEHENSKNFCKEYY